MILIWLYFFIYIYDEKFLNLWLALDFLFTSPVAQIAAAPV